MDRDGTLNVQAVREGKPYAPTRFEEFRLFDGVPAACRALKAAGFVLVVATNQPDVGRGEVPRSVIEAAWVDGAGLIRQMRSVILPIISPGLAATALICFIFAWNEFFLAVNLTTVNAATVPIYLVGFVQPEGPFLAHLSAAATIACLPVLIAGWAAQDKLVRGLSMGAVK